MSHNGIASRLKPPFGVVKNHKKHYLCSVEDIQDKNIAVQGIHSD